MDKIELEFQKSVNRLAIAKLINDDFYIQKELALQMKLTREALRAQRMDRQSA